MKDSTVKIKDLSKLGYVKVKDLEELGYVKATLRDRVYFAMSRASWEINNPKQINREELYRRVKESACDIGIENVIVTANDRNKNIWFVDDVVREKRYRSSPKYKHGLVNIGYFRRNDKGLYTVRSFEYNPWVFSDDKTGEFLDSLRKIKLEPHMYHPLGTVFYTDEQIKAWNERKLLYQ